MSSVIRLNADRLFLFNPFSKQPHRLYYLMPKNAKIEIENVNCPGQVTNVDAETYSAMKEVLLKILPSHAPGMIQSEMQKAILPHLRQDLWPDGAKSGWWAKTVQLDLEAKKIIARTDTKPLTWHRV